MNTPSVTTSMRVRLRHLRAEAHAQADRLADLLAERRGHARRRRRAPRAGAAPARGFCLSFAHGSSSSTSGTRVVLPAPGGATSTAHCTRASAAVSGGSASSMGRGVEMLFIWSRRHRPRRRAIQWRNALTIERDGLLVSAAFAGDDGLKAVIPRPPDALIGKAVARLTSSGR